MKRTPPFTGIEDAEAIRKTAEKEELVVNASQTDKLASAKGSAADPAAGPAPGPAPAAAPVASVRTMHRFLSKVSCSSG